MSLDIDSFIFCLFNEPRHRQLNNLPIVKTFHTQYDNLKGH
jgi:hypothetical protein